MTPARRRTAIRAALAAALLGGLGVLGEIGRRRVALGPTDGAGWRPIDWPLPPDLWPAGRAWRQRDDGTEVLVRIKRGFCSGGELEVLADEQVELLTDVDRLDADFRAAGDSRRVRVTDLFGRARSYARRDLLGSEVFAEAIVVSYGEQFVVALFSGGGLRDEAVRKKAWRFLESNTVQVWLNQQLDSR